MKILRAKIDWIMSACNDPRLQILVDKIPDRKDLTYTCRRGRGINLYFAEKDGYVSFFAWSGHGNDGGYGGSEWDIKVGRKIVRVKGPWSSRPGVMNQYFTQCMEAAMTNDPETYEKGYTFMAGSITIEKAKEALALMQGMALLKVVDDDKEIHYVPVKLYSNRVVGVSLQR